MYQRHSTSQIRILLYDPKTAHSSRFIRRTFLLGLKSSKACSCQAITTVKQYHFRNQPRCWICFFASFILLCIPIRSNGTFNNVSKSAQRHTSMVWLLSLKTFSIGSFMSMWISVQRLRRYYLKRTQSPKSKDCRQIFSPQFSVVSNFAKFSGI